MFDVQSTRKERLRDKRKKPHVARSASRSAAQIGLSVAPNEDVDRVGPPPQRLVLVHTSLRRRDTYTGRMRIGGQEGTRAIGGRIRDAVIADPQISRRLCQWLDWRSDGGGGQAGADVERRWPSGPIVTCLTCRRHG